MTSQRKAAHAARRAVKARRAFAAAATPRDRLAVAYRSLTAADVPDRTLNAVARRLMAIADHANARASGRPAATRLSDSRDERLAS